MSNVAIVTDTNSGLSPEEGRRLGIHVIPMPVIIDGKDYLEHVNITHSELYQAIRAGKEVELVRKYRNASIEQSAYLWPIPVVELQTNKAITEQNPGY